MQILWLADNLEISILFQWKYFNIGLPYFSSLMMNNYAE